MRSFKGSSANNNGKKSEASTRGAAGGKARQLSTEELDQVAGGKATITPVASSVAAAELSAVTPFSSSHIALDAASMQSGKTEAELAQAVGAGQGTEAQAVHLLEVLALADNTNAVQALAVFGGDMVGQGQAADAHLVGTQIAALIDPTIALMSAAQATMQFIGDAVHSGQLSANNAVEVLAGVASGSATLQVQAAAGGEIAALVDSHAISAQQAFSDITGLAGSGDIAPANLVGLLAGYGLAGSAQMQAAAGIEIAALIQTNALPTQETLSKVIDVMEETGAGFGLLANIAANGNQNFQVEVGAMIGQAQEGEPHQALLLDVGAIAAAFSAGQLPATDALAVLVGYGTNSAAMGQAAGIEIANLVQSVGPSETTTVVNTIIGNIFSPGGLLTSNPPPNAELSLCNLLVGMSTSAYQSVGYSAGGEVGQLLSQSVGDVTPEQAVALVTSAVGAKQLTADNAFYVLVGMNMANDYGLQTGGAIGQLIQNDGLAAKLAFTEITLGGLQPLYALEVLVGIAAAGNATLQAEAGGQIAQWFANGNFAATTASTVPELLGFVTGQVEEGDIAPGNAVGLLLGMAAAGNQSFQIDVGGELATLVKQSILSAEQVSADIANAVSAGLLTSAQAQEVLGGMA